MYLKILLFLLLTLTINAAQTRIINGSDVKDSSDKWAFTVSYRYDNEHNCGGTLIAPTWVLSAAHCWMDPLSDLDTVNVGSYLLANQHAHAIKRVIVHPDYDERSNDNDLLLFELVNPVTDILPVVLDRTATLAKGVESWVAGWGTTTAGTGIVSPRLKEVCAPIVDFDECNASYDGALTQHMICAGYMQGGKDSCQGDSGGPLINYANGQWVQSGIVSWGDGCAQPGYPGIYTKVQHYIEWIESYTGALARPDPLPATLLTPTPSLLLYLLGSTTL